MTSSIEHPRNSFMLVIAGSFLGLSILHDDPANAGEPVVVFRSVDDVRQHIARWEAEDLELTERDPIIEVKMENGKPTLGVKLDDDPLGPEVMLVVSGTAADLAGMKKGDHLKSINKADVDSPKDAAILVERQPAGAVMELEFVRNNYTYERRIRFLPSSDAAVTPRDSSNYLRDQVEELQRRLIETQKQNRRLQAAVRFLLDDRVLPQ